MSDARAFGQEVQSQILDTVAKSQTAVVDAIKTWADTVSSNTPDLPAVPQVFDRLPRPAEIVSGAYDFAEQVLRSQRQFAEQVLEAAAPVLPKREHTLQS